MQDGHTFPAVGEIRNRDQLLLYVKLFDFVPGEVGQRPPSPSTHRLTVNRSNIERL